MQHTATSARRAALLAPLLVPAWRCRRSAAGTLDKVKRKRQARRFGYRADTRPFAFSDEAASRPASRSRCARRWPTQSRPN